MDLDPTISTRYRAYLQTPEWKKRRNRALKRALYHCARCGAKRGLQVHHVTYERLECEADEDLEVLCADCHEGHHIQEMHDSPVGRVYLKLAHEVKQRKMFASFADLAEDIKVECAKLKMPYDAHQLDRALEFVCAAKRWEPGPPETRAEVIAEQGGPLSHQQSKEALRRTGLEIFIKTMPSVVSRIDIYGPIPRDEDAVDHDRY